MDQIWPWGQEAELEQMVERRQSKARVSWIPQLSSPEELPFHRDTPQQQELKAMLQAMQVHVDPPQLDLNEELGRRGRRAARRHIGMASESEQSDTDGEA